MTMTLVSTVTVGAGGAASIEFTGIAGTATDLLLLLSLRATDAGSDFVAGDILLNNSYTSANKRIVAFGGTPALVSNSGSDMPVNSVLSTSNTFTNIAFYLPNYTSTTNKTASVDAIAENNSSGSYGSRQIIHATQYNVTSAITSVKFANAGTLAQYSTASLYTITKGSGGATVA